MKGHTGLRRQNVSPHEGAISGKPFHIAFDEYRIVWKFPGDKTCVAKDGADAALYIGPGISSRSTGLERQLIKDVFHSHQLLRGLFQRDSTFMEGHGTKGCAADLPAVLHYFEHINTGGIHSTHGLTPDGINDCPAATLANGPLS